MTRFLFWGLILALLAGCGKAPFGSGGCGADIDWIDFVKLNDITYNQLSVNSDKADDSQLGKKIGEVRYTLNNHACTDHKSKNGDASYLAVGTPIYEAKGYAATFRVVADHKVYQANGNPHAKTVADLWDIRSRVDRVSLESGYDGSPIGDFKPEAASSLIDAVLELQYVGFEEVYPKIQHESGVFLRIHLKDGTSFRAVYYPKAQAFSAGFFVPAVTGDLIMSERSRIKAAAGL
ncbi:hypothetical protein [Cohnella sp. AR92]|uniref:hypothetical protein n=1 Tax=Cohnella sp. AR92 TaxID=648716 RepID=UPI000F8C9BDA|nr:hypothetical protein [Cohnella sp. AR92]RUS45968.1 hypothetical protein ELR57_16080 [Cohnella sp. AR92]